MVSIISYFDSDKFSFAKNYIPNSN